MQTCTILIISLIVIDSVSAVSFNDQQIQSFANNTDEITNTTINSHQPPGFAVFQRLLASKNLIHKPADVKPSVLSTDIGDSIRSTKMNYADEKNEEILNGYMTFPIDITKRYPGIIIAYDSTECSNKTGFDQLADRLARLGYIVFAYDAITTASSGNGTLLQANYRLKLLNRTELAIGQLQKAATFNGAQIFAIGYGFGGKVMLDVARNNIATVLKVITVFGALDQPRNDHFGDQQRNRDLPISARILVIHAHSDPTITPIDVIKFEDEMTDRDADWQMIVYGGRDIGHAFAVDGCKNYDPMMANRAWMDMVQFLSDRTLPHRIVPRKIFPHGLK